VSKFYVVDRRRNVEISLSVGDPGVEGRIILKPNPTEQNTMMCKGKVVPVNTMMA
jgi:hypothetical protein